MDYRFTVDIASERLSIQEVQDLLVKAINENDLAAQEQLTRETTIIEIVGVAK